MKSGAPTTLATGIGPKLRLSVDAELRSPSTKSSPGGTAHGSSPFAQCQFKPGDVFVFGSETRGLDPELRNSFPPAQRIRLPMRPDNRSLNLSNTVAVVVFEAWRQNGYVGGA